MMLAIDQYNQVIHLPGKHPRKELLLKTGYAKAEKMYIDKADGRTVHIGYVVGGRWFRLYALVERET